jgi:hypothetical protein
MKNTEANCRQSRVCAQCSFEQERMLEPVVAAFEHGRVWRDPCAKCGSRKFRSMTCTGVGVSPETMEVWSIDKKACFISQDEQLLLEQVENIDLLIEYLGRPATLKQKKKMLLAAVLTLLYRALAPGRENLGVVERAVVALSKRRSTLSEIGTRHISGRVLKRVESYLSDVLPH